MAGYIGWAPSVKSSSKGNWGLTEAVRSATRQFMAAEAPAVPATEDDLEALFDAAVAETREEKKAPAAPAPAPVVSQPRVRTRVAPRKRVKARVVSQFDPPRP